MTPKRPCAQGHSMLQPRVEARILQDLRSAHRPRAGNWRRLGYMAALLAHRAERVVSLEINPTLASMARENLRNAGVQTPTCARATVPVMRRYPDGPFDVIVLSGSVVAQVPKNLLALLRDGGGRLGAIVGSEPVMRSP